jgi:hypothetical protein
MTDVEMIQAALKELGEDLTLDKLIAWVEAKKTLDAVTSGGGDKPADQAAASDAPADEPTKLEDPPDEMEPAASPADDAIAAVAAAAGVEPDAVLAFILEQPDAVAALMAGGAGNPADQAPMLAKANELVTKLRKESATRDSKITELTKQVAKIEEERRLERATHSIELAIEKGHIKDDEREWCLELARSGDGSLLSKHLSRAAENPVVPTGTRTQPVEAGKQPPRKPVADYEPDTSSEEYQSRFRALGQFRRYQRDKDARHARVVEDMRIAHERRQSA